MIKRTVKRFLRRRKLDKDDKYRRKYSSIYKQERLKKRKKRFKKVMMVYSIITALAVIGTISSLAAASTDDGIKMYQLNIPRNNILFYMTRSLGWAIVQGLYFIVNLLENAVFSVNGEMGKILENQDVRTLLTTKILPIAALLIVIMISYIGICILMRKDGLKEYANNLVFGVIVFLSITTLITTAYDITNASIEYITGGMNSSIAGTVVLNNIKDSTVLDKEGFAIFQSKKHYYDANSINDAMRLNPVEMMVPDSATNSDLWATTFQSDGSSGAELGSGKMLWKEIPMLSEYYYRWDIDWLSIYATLGIAVVALVLSGIKIARLMFELVYKQTIAQVLSLLSLHDSSRLKKVLQSIMASFFTMIGCYVLLEFFIIGMGLASTITNIATRLLVMFGIGWAVIDGPDIFQQIFGIDVGAQSATRALVGASAAANLARTGRRALFGKGGQGGLANVVKKSATAASDLAGSAGGAVAGNVAGRLEAHKERKANQSRNNHSSQAYNASSDFDSRKSSSADNKGGSSEPSYSTYDNSSDPSKSTTRTMENPNSMHSPAELTPIKNNENTEQEDKNRIKNLSEMNNENHTDNRRMKDDSVRETSDNNRLSTSSSQPSKSDINHSSVARPSSTQNSSPMTLRAAIASSVHGRVSSNKTAQKTRNAYSLARQSGLDAGRKSEKRANTRIVNRELKNISNEINSM